MKRTALFLMAVAIALISCPCQAKKLFKDNTTGVVTYKCNGYFKGKTIDVYYHIPEGDVKNMPVQVVMHGMGRNGDGYRDAWIKSANKYKFIVITPNFSQEQFDDEFYQRGNVIDANGNINPKKQMTYALIDQVFDFFVKHSSSKAKTYNLYGHSAGGQFVHRFLMFYDTPKIDRAIAANPGWYSFPDESIPYPYGIGKSGVDLKAFYAKNLTILLGDADTLRTSNLQQTPEADLQGLNRYQRGNNFFEYCRKDAEAKGYEFNWQKAYVKGVGHSNKKMGPKAAAYIYGK